MPHYRSVSQLGQFLECGEAYRLQRIERHARQPAWWFIQGSATHAAIELYEYVRQDIGTADLFDMYESEWQSEMDAAAEAWPAVDEWMTGTKKRSSKEDAEERFAKGWNQVLEYVEWTKTRYSYRVATLPSGEPAVEVPFELDLGGVTVVGKIDQILTGGRVWDFKGGNKKPENDFQLGVYALAATEIMGKPYTSGEFYYAKVNNTLPSVDTTKYTRERLTAIFQSLDRSIKAENFMPNPVNGCWLCGVKRHCWIYNDRAAKAAA